MKLQLIEQDVFCIALPARHPLAGMSSLALAELADEAFIGYVPARASTLHAAMTQLCLQAGIMPRVTQEGVQVQTVIGLVASGLGVAIVPAIHAQYSSRRVIFRPIRDLPAGSDIGISVAYPTSRETAAARRLREIAAALPPGPGADPALVPSCL